MPDQDPDSPDTVTANALDYIDVENGSEGKAGIPNGWNFTIPGWLKVWLRAF